MSADVSDAPKSGSRRRGLGMGLSVLLGTDGEGGDPSAIEPSRTVPIEFLQPSPLQPRRHFAEDDLAGLAESIRAKGVMQPLLVRRAADGADHFEIVAGERRWRAAQLAGLHELPIIIHELSDRDALEVALLENVQRQDLSPLEEAEGYRRLLDEFGHTQDALASVLGKSRSHIANLLRLLGLPEPVRTMLEAGKLTAGHARALLVARDPVDLGKAVAARGLNVRQTEALVRAESAKPRQSAPPPRNPDTLALEQELSKRLGLSVSLKSKGVGGTLCISYHSLDQLDGLIRRFG